MDGRILSLCLSEPKTVHYRGEEVRTGIFKVPAEGPVFASIAGLEGDGQADLRFHGGEHKAIYAYPADHYRYWEQQICRALPHGAFGENLTVAGFDESTSRIGDIFAVGEAMLQVSEPRIPCFKLVMRMQAGADFSTRFLASGRSGMYFRVLREGSISPGDTLRRVESDSTSPSVLEFVALTQWAGRNPERLRRAATARGLSAAWRTNIRNKLSQALTSSLGNGPGEQRMRVTEIRNETDTIRSIYLVPDNLAVPFRHLAGQFLPITLSDQRGRPVRRSYSISSPPGADALRLTVRLERNPDGSPGSGSGLIHALKPGDVIVANPPAGNFHPDPDATSGLVLAGAGIGMTPLVAMAADALAHGRTVRMLLSTRRRSDLPLTNDLLELQAAYPQFCLEIVQTGGIDAGPRLTADRLGALDDREEVYLCGPPGFVSDLRMQLAQGGVPAWRVLSETFEPVSATKPIDCEPSDVSFSELSGSVINIGETLLETAEAQGLSPPSGCRAGSCGLCVTRLASGKVRYVEPVDHPDDELVHICVAAPDGAIELGPLGMGGGAQAMPQWTEDQLAKFFQ